jgi:hypothetical protein
MEPKNQAHFVRHLHIFLTFSEWIQNTKMLASALFDTMATFVFATFIGIAYGENVL